MGHSPTGLVEVEDKMGYEDRRDAGEREDENTEIQYKRRGEGLNGSASLVTYDVFVNGVCRGEFWKVLRSVWRGLGSYWQVRPHREENEQDVQDVHDQQDASTTVVRQECWNECRRLT